MRVEFIEASAKDNSNVEILKEEADEVPVAEEKPPATTETDTIKLSDKSVTAAKDGWCYC